MTVLLSPTFLEIILQSAGKVISNYSQIDYFQEVIRTNRPVIAPPRKSSATGEYSIVLLHL